MDHDRRAKRRSFHHEHRTARRDSRLSGRNRLRLWLTITLLYILAPSRLAVSAQQLLQQQQQHQQQQQKFANEPSPQTAVIGSTVVMPCRIVNKVGVLQWTRDDFGLGNERELHAFKRYHMIGSDEEGDFSLRISPVTLEDEAYFQCQVTGWRDIPGVRSQTAKLTVYVPPEPPQIIQGALVTTTAGSGVQLQCVSKGGKPAAELQWLDGSGHVVTEGVQYSTELMEDGHRSNAKSVLSFLASKQHHNSAFTCTASNPAVRHAENVQVRLEVRYPPEVTITHDRDGYREGETAILTCTADANPNILSFRWYRDGQLVTEENSTQLVINRVTKSSSLQDIACEVSNEVGSSKKITRLIIHYGPSFLVQPSDQYAVIGENVTLTCEVDSSPDSTIVWIDQQSQMVVGKGSELQVLVSRETLGAYLCIAKVEGFPEISASVGIFLKGPPKVRSERQQWGEQGDTVLVECIITAASARSLTVSWTHHGRQVDLDSGRYEVIQDVTTSGVRHTLVIRNAQPTDFGAYNCSVQNAYGSDIHEIILIKKKTLPLLLMVGGLSGGIILVVVAAMGVIMWARRSAAQRKENKGYGLPEKTVTLKPTDLKIPVDQMTGSSLNDKETELGGWEAENEKPPSPTYLASTTSYIYPDAFTAIPLRINGQLANNRDPHGAFNNHPNGMNNQQLQQQQQPNPQSPMIPGNGTTINGINSLIGTTYMPKMQMANHSLTSQPNQHPYPNYGVYEANQPLNEGDPRFLPGFSNRSFRVPSNGTASMSPSANGPRFAGPLDRSQHITSPPQKQLLEDAMGTHV